MQVLGKESLDNDRKKDNHYNLDDVGLYDETKENEKMMRSLKEEGEKDGIKKGANNEKKSIAKNLLKDGLPIPKVCEYTGLSEKQIARLI